MTATSGKTSQPHLQEQPAHTPMTPLPWLLSSSVLVCSQNADVVANCLPMDAVGVPANEAAPNAEYITHACNAYPKLVAELHNAETYMARGQARLHIKQLLRELGELK